MTAAARAARSDFGVTAISLLSFLRDAVALEDLFVELDSEARPGGDLHVALTVEWHRLFHELLVDRRVRDAVLLEHRVRQYGVHMQRRRLDDPTLPGMR